MSNADYKMPFGKYKGTELIEIYEDDPDYLQWCAENIKQFDVRNTIEDFLQEVIARDKRWGRK